MGLPGSIVSDYFAINELHDRRDTFGHHVAHDAKDAARLAVQAGVDIELPDPDCYPHLLDLVREGAIAESVIDQRVRAVLRAKFLMRLFDDPYVDPAEAERLVREPSHRDLALEAARKTITLLKNEAILPLRPTEKMTIAVIGPNAARVMLGGYSEVPLSADTVLGGIRSRECLSPSKSSTTRAAGSRSVDRGTRTRSSLPNPTRTAA